LRSIAGARHESPRVVHGLLLTGFTLAVLLPFLGKAFHIDDPLFV